jgi:hypothetical protein
MAYVAHKTPTTPQQQDAAARDELLRREFAGEKNVLTTRITSLEQTAREQSEQLARLLGQAEKACGQVQETAVRAIEGSASAKQLTHLQQNARRSGPKRRRAVEVAREAILEDLAKIRVTRICLKWQSIGWKREGGFAIDGNAGCEFIWRRLHRPSNVTPTHDRIDGTWKIDGYALQVPGHREIRFGASSGTWHAERRG